LVIFPNLFNISKIDYFKYFENNNAQRKTSMKIARGKRQQKTTKGATHLCNANWNHTKVMALINYK
jgi:hypothetical protein